MGRQHTPLLPLAGLCLLLVMLLPPLRHALEARMSTHMLVQFPALLLAGALLAAPLAQRWPRGLQRWNELGIAGLVAAAFAMALLMVPRVLDLALVDRRVETLKLLALLASGAALAVSWQRAGPVLQAFFLGNVLPMLAVVGTLYEDSPTRLCSAYLLDDQQRLGAALVGAAAGILVAWLLHLGVRQRGLNRALNREGTASPSASSAARSAPLRADRRRATTV
jgi:hypothetical protein